MVLSGSGILNNVGLEQAALFSAAFLWSGRPEALRSATSYGR